eukprot:superscaffoldBa00002038_g12951
MYCAFTTSKMSHQVPHVAGAVAPQRPDDQDMQDVVTALLRFSREERENLNCYSCRAQLLASESQAQQSQLQHSYQAVLEENRRLRQDRLHSGTEILWLQDANRTLRTQIQSLQTRPEDRREEGQTRQTSTAVDMATQEPSDVPDLEEVPSPGATSQSLPQEALQEKEQMTPVHQEMQASSLATPGDAVPDLNSPDDCQVPPSAHPMDAGAPHSDGAPLSVLSHTPSCSDRRGEDHSRDESGVNASRPPLTSELTTSQSSHPCLSRTPSPPEGGRSRPHRLGDLSDSGEVERYQGESPHLTHPARGQEDDTRVLWIHTSGHASLALEGNKMPLAKTDGRTGPHRRQPPRRWGGNRNHRVRTNTITEDIEVLVFLPKNNSFPFSYARVAPAILYAQRRLETNGGRYSGFHFNIQFENSDCVNDAAFKLVDRSCGKKPDLILGPVCEYEAAAVVRFASHWNIPVISAGALAAGFGNKNTEYSHLTRIAPSYVKMAETFTAMFEHFTWKTALLVYEDDKEERNCYFTLEGVYHLMTDFNIKTYSFSQEDRLDTDDIIQNMYDTEVAVCSSGASAAAAEELCVPSLSTAPRVFQPSSSGCVLTYAVLQMQRDTIDSVNEHTGVSSCPPQCPAAALSPSDNRCSAQSTALCWQTGICVYTGCAVCNGSWKRGDKYDSEAKQAYAFLNTVTLLKTVKPEFENFSMEMKKSSEKEGFHDCKDCGSVNMFVEGFHDAMLLYAIALHEAMKNGYSKKNGREITSHMWNRTFEVSYRPYGGLEG